MSAIGNITGPSLVPLPTLPGVVPASQPVAAAAATTPALSLEERLAAALIEIGGPASSVGLSGLYRPSAPGDLAVLLAQTSLTLEDTSDEATANRAKLALSVISQALRAFDPETLDALRQTEYAAKADAETVRAQIQAARNSPAARIAVLEALTDAKAKEAAAPELAALKAQMVDIAKNALDSTAAVLQKEIARLPAGDRRTAVEGELAATNQRKAGIGGSDAYAKAVSALSANDNLLASKVQAYDTAGLSATAALDQSLMAITSAVATISAAITARNSNEGADKGSRDIAIDELLSDILKASARADAPFIEQIASNQADGRLDEKTARNEDSNSAAVARFVESLLSAAADLASSLSRLDPLTISVPSLQPGRSRVRLDV